MLTRPRSPDECIIHDLLSSAAIRPGACTRYYDDQGRPLPPDSDLSQACFEGQRFWNSEDPHQGFWAYRIVPVEDGARRAERAQEGPLVPDRSAQAAAERLRAVEDYARWYPGFAAGEQAPAEHIWGMAQSAQSGWSGLYSYSQALRHCLLGLTRHGQLAALALAGIDDADDSTAAHGTPRRLRAAPSSPPARNGEHALGGTRRGSWLDRRLLDKQPPVEAAQPPRVADAGEGILLPRR